MPKRCSSAAGPTPESCSSGGVAMAPAARMISASASARQVSPWCWNATAPRRGLEITGALLARAVEIVVARDARLLRCGDEGLAQLVRVALVGDAERAAGAVERVGAALLVLGLLEIGQHVVVAPADIAELAPVVEILLLAADIDAAIDRARAAQHLAARLNDAAAVELGLGLALIEPVDLRVLEQLAVAQGDVDPGVAVLAAGLEQQHALGAGRREPVGEHAARRAAADDHVVEGAAVAHRCLPNGRSASLGRGGVANQALRDGRRRACPALHRSSAA